MRHISQRFVLGAIVIAGATLLSGCFGNGLWLVGVDIQPGLYRSNGAEDQTSCVYIRQDANRGVLSDADDTFSAPGQGPQYVEVAPGDHSFETAGCQMWIAAPDDQSALPGGPPLPDGMWRVGVDMAPGSYSTGGSAVCQWKRLSTARHDANSVIDSGFIGPAQFDVVTVAPNDAFFWTRGCDPWQMLQLP